MMTLNQLLLIVFLSLLAIVLAYCVGRAASIGHHKTKLEFLQQLMKHTKEHIDEGK